MKKIVLFLHLLLLQFPPRLEGEQTSHYNDELRKAVLERASSYSRQMHERVDSINRLAGYFAPKGVSVFNSERLGEALQMDSLQRQNTLSQMNQTLQGKIYSLQERETQTIRMALDEQGQLKSYDLSSIQKVSGQLEHLIQESNQLQIHLQSDFKEKLRGNVLVPYSNKSQIWQGHSSVEKSISNYLNGSGAELGGLKGFEKSLRYSQEQLNKTALSIQRTQENMKENLVQNTILGGMTLATSLIILIPSGGASVNGLALGLGIFNSTIGIGNSIRNQVILENKGLEGFRSANEQIFAESARVTQAALGAALTVLQISESLKSMTQPTPFTSREWIQTFSNLNQISEFNGFKQKAIGESASHALNATFALSDLIFSALDPPKEPSQLTKRSFLFKQSMDQIENIYTIAQGVPAFRAGLEQNPDSQFFITSLRLTRNLGTKLLDRALYNQLKDRSFKLEDVKPFFDLSILKESQIKKYIAHPENEFALNAVYETMTYGKQTQADPYALQKKMGETIETKYFIREIKMGEQKNIKMPPGELALLASLYKVNPTLNSYNLTAPNHFSHEDRKDFLFTLPHKELEKVLKGEDTIFNYITPEKILDITVTNNGFEMGPYKSYQSPLGLVYRGEVRIHSVFEMFTLPEIGALTSLPPQTTRALGGGFIRMGNEPPLKYSGLYTVQWWKGLNEIYTAAIGGSQGGLMIGVGAIRENFREARLGFILPTGSGILLEPTHRPGLSHSVAYQGLNQKWSSLFEKPNHYFSSNEDLKNINYLISVQFEKSLKINSLKYFFNSVPELISTIDHSFGKTASFSSKGEVSLSSLAKFYEKTDPTHGGIYQMSYSYSTPHFNIFEFATRSGFQYERYRNRNRSNSEEISAQWNVPIYLNHWLPASAIYKQSSSNKIYFSSWEKGLTLKTYQSLDPLHLDTVYFNNWKNNSKLLTQESEIWTRYEDGLKTAKVALELTRMNMSRNPLREQKSFIGSNPIIKMSDGSRRVRPLLKISAFQLAELTPAFLMIYKTRLIDTPALNHYKKEKESILNSFHAVNALVPQLKDWNRASQDARLYRAIFESTEYQINQRDLLWKGLNSSAIKLLNLEKVLGSDPNTRMEEFHKQLTQSSYLIHFTPSAIEYGRTKVTFKESPLLIPSSLNFFMRAIALEGDEEKNVWKKSVGTLGGKIIDYLPISPLGGRMITIYEVGPPSNKKLINLWLWQTMEDSLKFRKLVNWKYKLPKIE